VDRDGKSEIVDAYSEMDDARTETGDASSVMDVEKSVIVDA